MIDYLEFKRDKRQEFRISSELKNKMIEVAASENKSVADYIIDLIIKDISFKEPCPELVELYEKRKQVLSSIAKNPQSDFFKRRLAKIENEIIEKGGK